MPTFKSNPQCFSHLKNRLNQEQLVHEGLNLNKQFVRTYFTAHELIKTFIHHNKQLIKNMTAGQLSNGPIEGVNRNIKKIKRTAYYLSKLAKLYQT